MSNNKTNVLISMCLCGVHCRYDGRDVHFEAFDHLSDFVNLIPICPEIMGGLPTPRPPAEKIDNRIVTNEHEDVSEQYVRGAFTALSIAKKFKCNVAILKEYSPSCGVNKIYDGSFTGRKIEGLGVTAKLLIDNGLEVYSDEDIEIFIRKYIKVN